MRFVLFTKTRWQEPPRLRHQVAQMLVRRGHSVTFFEKCDLLGGRMEWESDGIQFRRHGELLYHQLRVFPWLSRMNWAYERNALRRQAPLGSDSVVINFNFDYWGLRDLFPRQPVLTIINDDFVAWARWFSRREARRVLKETVQMSDHTLVVSYPLLDQLRPLTEDVSLFLPWARGSYRRPAASPGRDAILYWGWISDRLDLDAITGVLDSGVRIHFVGPVAKTTRSIQQLLSHANARYHPPAQLDELEPVLAECACSILPYDSANPKIRALTVSNRAFQILSVGLVLLYCDLPGLIDAPSGVIYRCRDTKDYLEAFESARAGFEGVQPSIEAFLSEHSEEARYTQMCGVVERARTRRESFG